LELLRVILERLFVNHIPAQHHGLEQVLKDVPADIIVGDDRSLGCCRRSSISINSATRPMLWHLHLHWPREDGAPDVLGLPPAASPTQHAATIQEHKRIVRQPLAQYLNRCLKRLGLGSLVSRPFEAMVRLADIYWQLTVLF
jgi:hypothetical protein